MAIDQKYIDLINADIDGEIQDAERAELETFLAGSAEGRELHAELAAIGEKLDGLETLEPPPHLKHVIMNTIPAEKPEKHRPGFLQTLLALPALRYAATFVGGALLTMSLVGSNRISETAFDDVSGLVGTIANPESLGPAVDSISISESEIAGTVSLRNTGSMLILDFDLVSGDQVDIIADYADRSIWFNGFAQLESSGTSVSAETGRVTLSMQGKRRYAVFLHNREHRDAEIALRFLSGDNVLHESTLNFGATE
jgi:hypothetical protein